jgi:hypothetical protein
MARPPSLTRAPDAVAKAHAPTARREIDALLLKAAIPVLEGSGYGGLKFE